MARDSFIRQHRCHYCGRPGFAVRGTDLYACGHEACRALAFAEAHRRRQAGGDVPERARLRRYPPAREVREAPRRRRSLA